MPIGGGTFSAYDKEIPGIYANFNNVNSNDLNPKTGTVAFLIPVINENQPPVTLVTPSTYKTEIVNFVTVSGRSNDELISECTEMFCNATQIYLVPIKTKYADSHTYTDETKITIATKLTTIDFNALVCNDVFNDGFVIKTILEYTKDILENSNKRFIITIFTIHDDSKTELSNCTFKKWIVVPYKKESIHYISGIIASLEPGENVSGKEYTGFLSTNDWEPPTIEDQKKALNAGEFSYYSIGNSLRVLKDITLEHSNKNGNYNDKIGQIVRLEKYMYDWFFYLFSTQIQGYPNTERYRNVLKGSIYSQMSTLEEQQVIQDVNPDHIKVSSVVDKKDAILIEITYKPVSGIDYVYIKFSVD